MLRTALAPCNVIFRRDYFLKIIWFNFFSVDGSRKSLVEEYFNSKQTRWNWLKPVLSSLKSFRACPRSNGWIPIGHLIVFRHPSRLDHFKYNTFVIICLKWFILVDGIVWLLGFRIQCPALEWWLYLNLLRKMEKSAFKS